MRTSWKVILGIIVIGFVVFTITRSLMIPERPAPTIEPKEQATQKTQAPPVKIDAVPAARPSPVISYLVLREWQIPTQHTPAGGSGMELLVSPSNTKEQVIRLAESLRSKYAVNNRFLQVDIFDDKTAYLNRENESYPQSKFMKHYLVCMTVNPNTGYNEIQWMAEGRDH